MYSRTRCRKLLHSSTCVTRETHLPQHTATTDYSLITPIAYIGLQYRPILFTLHFALSSDSSPSAASGRSHRHTSAYPHYVTTIAKAYEVNLASQPSNRWPIFVGRNRGLDIRYFGLYKLKTPIRSHLGNHCDALKLLIVRSLR